MIEPQPGRDGKRLAAAAFLRRGKKNLFLHADVLEQTRAEFGVSGGVDIFRVGHGALEQGIEALVIARQIAVNFSGHKRSTFDGPAKTFWWQRCDNSGRQFEFKIFADQYGGRIENVFFGFRVQRQLFSEARMFRQFFLLRCSG